LSDLAFVVERWTQLPPSVRNVIRLLVESQWRNML
jgi:hypothetical protein